MNYRFGQFLNNWKSTVHRTEPAHCSVRPSSISKPAQGHTGVNWPDPTGCWLARTRLGTVPTVHRRRPPAPRVAHAATIPCAVPLAGARTLASCTRDSCVTAAATSRRRCRLAATSAPRATHAAATPCVTPSRCRSVGEAVSRLPAKAAERRTLRSLSPHSSAPLSPHSSVLGAKAPTTPHHSRVPPRHTKPVAEPPSTASNR
jgi:hypothetical protein